VRIAHNQTLELGANQPFTIEAGGWTTSQLNAYFDKVVGLGGKWIRAWFNWPYIKNTGATGYTYAAYDTFVNAATAKNLKVSPILSYGGAEIGTQAYADYFQTVAAHFASLGVHHFELYNEKNVKNTFNSNNTPAHYATILQAAYPALKAGDPTCKVLFSGLTVGTVGVTTGNDYSAPDFLQGVYDAGAGDCYDIMNYHPYGHVQYVVQRIREVMEANGDRDKMMWFTEDGIPTGGTSGQYYVPQWKQAAYYQEGIRQARQYGFIGKYFIYNGNDSIYRNPTGRVTSVSPAAAY
jgi:hypothetical protein